MKRRTLGVDLGGTKIEAALLDSAGGFAWRRRVPTPRGDYAATLDAIAGLLRAAETQTGAPCTAVGVGTPGSETDDGLMRNANSTCLNGRPLRRDLESLLARPVRLANDANCLALSEAADGAAAGADVVFAVILGTGVGGGLVVHGRLLAGANGLAGEWGHNPLPWPDAEEVRNAPTCWCGQRGCIESWLGGPALARDHATRFPPADGAAPLDAERIAANAAAGDATCESSLRRYEDRLARALASVVNLLDPDVIVLGGGLSRIDRLYERVPALWQRHAFRAGPARPALRTRLVKSLHGDASGVRGAAWLWDEPGAGLSAATHGKQRFAQPEERGSVTGGRG